MKYVPNVLSAHAILGNHQIAHWNQSVPRNVQPAFRWIQVHSKKVNSTANTSTSSYSSESGREEEEEEVASSEEEKVESEEEPEEKTSKESSEESSEEEMEIVSGGYVDIPKGVSIESYLTIGEEIGVGAFGAVYQGTEKKYRRNVAIKVRQRKSRDSLVIGHQDHLPATEQPRANRKD